ncbi:MAG: hypothetical protein KF782_10415 [Labilithrix sp.]|nr:hypothetical protein [Labilithrix sp.]
MKLTAELAQYPAGRPLNADQIVEYHAARLLLLMHLCGTKGEIHGLTKLAKLDFFVRYPAFFERATKELDAQSVAGTLMDEATMVRHHYGPWDPRYYQLLAFLEGRELIAVEKEKKTFIFALTDLGTELAKRLSAASPFVELVQHMKQVKGVFSEKSGDWLKKIVYRVFDDEVAKLSLGEVIR